MTREEAEELMRESVDNALGKLDDPRLNSLPRELLVTFASMAASEQVMNFIARQVGDMLGADRKGKQ